MHEPKASALRDRERYCPSAPVTLKHAKLAKCVINVLLLVMMHLRLHFMLCLKKCII